MRVRINPRIRITDTEQPRAGMRPIISMREALDDDALLGSILDGDSWEAWRVMLIATMGERLTSDERKLFTKLTGRKREPMHRVDEAAFVVGRRGGKSRAMSVLATYIGGLCDHQHVLAPGERGVLLCIAPDQKQAKITLDYTAAAFEQSKMLRQLIDDRTADTLRLKNGIDVEVRAASFRRLRGPTYIAVLADEAAFWYGTDGNSVNADIEILNSVRPGLATTGGPLIIGSSPYARRGELWQLYKANYGPDGDPNIIVAQGASRTFNPSLPQSVVDRAYARDAAAASAEYGGLFRTDIESFLNREVVEACVSPGVRERLFLADHNYVAFTDPSGGSADSFTLAIAHCEGDGIILDAVRERKPPFSPDDVAAAFCALLQSYRITTVIGDRYGGEFPRELFRKHGVQYEPSAKPKSDLYRDFLPLLNSKRADLLDNDRLVGQLAGLERRTARGGKDSIDHAPNGHDDVANAVAGVCVLAANYTGAYDESLTNMFIEHENEPSSAVSMISALAFIRGGF
ncbi:hypothetical protein [Pseudorhodoplanes sp.]|uniref:hypothetical protein n=1 Tax=Pseudorhodoplanes sp. TaxID=1934341 RepID=UPI003D10041F